MSRVITIVKIVINVLEQCKGIIIEAGHMEGF